MVNYNNGKIYTIRSRSRPDLIYVGSTTQPLSKRLGEHRHSSNRCSSKQIIDLGDAYIELVEEYSCSNKEQLHRREGQLMRSLNCVNKAIAGRTRAEHYKDNKDKISKQKKQYRSDNKDKIKQYYKDKISKKQKEYQQQKRRVCVCGGKYVDKPSNATLHYNTDKHIDWVDGFYTRLQLS